MQHGSWTYCARCASLHTKKLLPSFRRRAIPKKMQSCHCMRKRYKIALPRDVPVALRNLTEAEVRALRPLEISSSKYQRRQHGYRVRTEPFDVRWSKDSVERKLRDIADPASRERATRAYRWLISSAHSPYSHFVRLRDSRVRDPWLFEIYTHEEFQGVEAALWPNLYFDRDLCESVLDGKKTRASGKVSFTTKVASVVVDFGLHYDLQLLHYQYDRWLCKTVTGAINTATKSCSSPPLVVSKGRPSPSNTGGISIGISLTQSASLGSLRCS